jgi:hypothetical protein
VVFVFAVELLDKIEVFIDGLAAVFDLDGGGHKGAF